MDGVTRLADVIVPEVYLPYEVLLTKQKSPLIVSGAMTESALLTQFLAGGGLTVNLPSWIDLDNDEEYISNDDPADVVDGRKISALKQTAVRLSRNNKWSVADLVSSLTGSDPMQVIVNRTAAYWARRFEQTGIAVLQGVFAHNAGTPAAPEVANDMSHDISNGGTFADGVTTISAEAVIDAQATMGESMNDLALMIVHPIVMTRLRKNNLIEYIVPSENSYADRIMIYKPTGCQIILDANVPNDGASFDTYLLGKGCLQYGFGQAKIPMEFSRDASAGHGGGIEHLHIRKELCVHPVGYQFVGTPIPAGGPSNANTAGNFANAASWLRVFPERQQVAMARLVTCEV